MALNVCSVWTGATTSTTARVKARLTSAGSGTLLVADNEAMTGPASFGPVASGADNVIVWDVSGLSPNSRYWLLVNDGALNPSFKATFRTHPGPIGEPASYIFGAAGDAGLAGGSGDSSNITNAVSNHPVFDTMRVQGAAEQWVWFSHLGDLHYRNIATNTVASFRTAYFENMNYGALVGLFRQGDFFRSLATTYVWDDHDYGPNNSNRTSAARPAAQQAYREWVPHYPLPDTAGIYQSWQVGRVLYIASDVRSFRDPNNDPSSPAKTMLGTAQKAWMENLLATSDAEALVWQTPSRWLASDSDTGDTWNSFAYERAEMIQMFGDTGWLHRMIQLTADKHSVSMCTGPGNPHGGFPVYMLAGMDCDYSDPDPLYDLGSIGGRGQYGTVRVKDDGHTIALTGTGYRDGAVLLAHTAYVDVGSPVIALDYQGGHISPPFEPVPDDEGVTNDVTASRQDGGEAHYVKRVGPLNVNDPADDPDGIGVYDGGDVTVNVARDVQLPDQASWRVHLGTVDEERYPLVHIDLAANPELADEMTELGLGDLMTIANPPEWLPPDAIRLIVEGGTETIGQYDWDVELNASPGAPWQVARLAEDAATAGPNQPNRLDTSGTRLVSAVTSGATGLVVHTSPNGIFQRVPWIISTGPAAAPNLLPAHFPFDVRLGGEVARVTACTPAAWDAFTRVTANGWGTSTSGHAWTASGGVAAEYSTNGTVGLHSMTAVNSSRYTLTAAPGPDLDMRADVSTPVLATGGPHYLHLVARWLDGNNNYTARLGFTATQTLELVIQKRVGGVQTDLTTVTVPGVHTAAAFYTVRLQLEGTDLRAKAWPRGTQEPGRWHATTTDTSLTAAGSAGVRTVLSSANTNTLPVAASYDNFEITTPQRMTVTRSINTVVKAQPAGASVSLAQPAPVPL